MVFLLKQRYEVVNILENFTGLFKNIIAINFFLKVVKKIINNISNRKQNQNVWFKKIFKSIKSIRLFVINFLNLFSDIFHQFFVINSIGSF